MLLRMQERLHKENQRRVAVMQLDLRVAEVTHSFQLNCALQSNGSYPAESVSAGI